MEVTSVRVSAHWHLVWARNVALTDRAEELARANLTGYLLSSPSCAVIHVVMKLKAEKEESISLCELGQGVSHASCKWKGSKGDSSTKCTAWKMGRAIKSSANWRKKKIIAATTHTHTQKENQLDHTVMRCYFSTLFFLCWWQKHWWTSGGPDRKKNKDATVGYWWGQSQCNFITLSQTSHIFLHESGLYGHRLCLYQGAVLSEGAGRWLLIQ